MLKAGGEGDDRGWDGWMASPTRWTWVWVSSGRWWWTGRAAIHAVRQSQTRLSDWTTTRGTWPLGGQTNLLGRISVCKQASVKRPQSSVPNCSRLVPNGPNGASGEAQSLGAAFLQLPDLPGSQRRPPGSGVRKGNRLNPPGKPAGQGRRPAVCLWGGGRCGRLFVGRACFK